jgi:hypothetical protein
LQGSRGTFPASDPIPLQLLATQNLRSGGRDQLIAALEQITEILEKVCDKKMDLYGLLLDKETGLPTENWSNDPVALRAKGGQITRIAMGTCSDVTNDYEDYIVNEAPKVCHIEGNEKKCQTRPLISGVCGTKGLGFCIGKDFNQMVNATQVQVPLNNGGGLPIVEL